MLRMLKKFFGKKINKENIKVYENKYHKSKKNWTKNINGHLIEYDWMSNGEVYVRMKSEIAGGWKELNLSNCNPEYKGSKKPKSWKQAKFMATKSNAAT